MMKLWWLRRKAKAARIVVENIAELVQAYRADLLALQAKLDAARSRLALADARVSVEEVVGARLV